MELKIVYFRTRILARKSKSNKVTDWQCSLPPAEMETRKTWIETRSESRKGTTPWEQKRFQALGCFLFEIWVHEMNLFAILNSGATPKTVSKRPCKQQSLRLELKNKVVAATNDDNSCIWEKLVHVPVLIAKLEMKFDLIAMKSIFSRVVIGGQMLKRIEIVPYLRPKQARLIYVRPLVVIEVNSKYARPRKLSSSIDSDDFRFDYNASFD